MKKLLKWIVGLISAIITSIFATGIINAFTNHSIFNSIWDEICKFFSLQIGIIWVILIIAAFLALMFVEYLYLDELYQQKDISKKETIPKFVSEYKRDIFNGAIWKWDWRKNYYGTWDLNLEETCNGWKLTGLHQCCPKDGTPLNPYSNQCPRCENTYPSGIDEDAMRIIIMDNVKRGLYPNHANRAKCSPA
jgi:hypothetical protein